MKVITKRVAGIPGSATTDTTEKARQLAADGHDVIDLSVAHASDPTPEHIVTAGQRALLSAFPVASGQGTMFLRNAAAAFINERYGITADPATEIMATFGFKQTLTLAIPTLLETAESILVEDPCFDSYHPIINLFGNEAIPVPLLQQNRFRWTEEQLEKAVRPDTKAILLCSPHNPTGVVHSASDLEIIAVVAKRRDLWVIADEMFQFTTWGGRKHVSICSLPGMRERTVTAVPLSKGFIMNAWRAGFVFAPPPIISILTKLLVHTIYCVPMPIQAGAVAALNASSLPAMTALWKDWEERCRYFSTEINSMPGIRCPMPEGGYFAWADIRETGLSSNEFAQKLLDEHHVVLVAGSKFGPAGEGYVRISMVRAWNDLERAVPRVRALANSCAAQKKVVFT